MQLQVVIVGGGVMGAATACFLARDHNAAVTVIERDPLYLRASSSLSASSIRQQFSQPVNIALSAWSMDFLRRIDEELAVPGQSVQISLVESGYLFLATAGGEATLRQRQATQQASGADVLLLDPEAMRLKFPWLNADDLALGSWGRQGEGWFDGPALAAAFRRKARHCGARFVTADVQHFQTQGDRVRAVKSACGQTLEADALVICAGAWSGQLSMKLGVDLPVVPRKRDVFVFDSPARLVDCPLVIDPSGLWFRPEGSGYICGAPPRFGDPDEPPLHEVDLSSFEESLWPALARRIPEFAALRLRSAWAGYYEMNLFDQNGLVGRLPGWSNLYTACGFSGHGMQQAPAVGCALAELVAAGQAEGCSVASAATRSFLDKERAPNVLALDPARLASKQPLFESAVI